MVTVILCRGNEAPCAQESGPWQVFAISCVHTVARNPQGQSLSTHCAWQQCWDSDGDGRQSSVSLDMVWG